MKEVDHINFIRQFRKPEIIAWMSPGEPMIDTDIIERKIEKYGFCDPGDLKFDSTLEFCEFKWPIDLEAKFELAKENIITGKPISTTIKKRIINEIEEVISRYEVIGSYNQRVSYSKRTSRRKYFLKNYYQHMDEEIIHKNTEPKDTIRADAKIKEGDFDQRLQVFYHIVLERLTNLKESLIRFDYANDKESHTTYRTNSEVDKLDINTAVISTGAIPQIFMMLFDEGFLSIKSDRKRFNQLFFGPKMDGPITWADKVGTLHYFFKELEKRKIVKDAGTGKWKLIWSSFKSKETGQRFNFESVRKYTYEDISKRKRRKIDAVLNNLSSK